MDAVKFIKERDRMCKTHGNCSQCPACLDNECIVARRSSFAPEQQINTVKVWAEQHPVNTQQSVLLKRWPNAARDREGVVNFCPKYVDVNYSCVVESGGERRLKKCNDCRHEFWLQEVEQKER